MKQLTFEDAVAAWENIDAPLAELLGRAVARADSRSDAAYVEYLRLVSTTVDTGLDIRPIAAAYDRGRGVGREAEA